MNENSMAKECGARLRRIRMARNMSQNELAEKLFTTPQNISKYEKEGISNIDTIMRLSKILGQDLLRDERDEEGTVGEVGREILSALIENRGYMEVRDLVEEHLYGMNMSRASGEIFKLEKIGMCVREQYRNFYDEESDRLFITAKGLITYKNSVTDLLRVTDLKKLLPEVSTYEAILTEMTEDYGVTPEAAGCYQDGLNTLPQYRLARSLVFAEDSAYRGDYIAYLKKRYDFPYEKDHRYCFGSDTDKLENRLYKGKDFAYDIVFRMIMDYDRDFMDHAASFSSPVFGLNNADMEADARFDELLGLGWKNRTGSEHLRAELGKLYLDYVDATETESADEDEGFEELEELDEFAEEDFEGGDAFENADTPGDADDSDEEPETGPDTEEKEDTAEEDPEDDAFDEILEQRREFLEGISRREDMMTEYYQRQRILELCEKYDSTDPFDWFTLEEIDAFVRKNILPAKNEDEKTIDRIVDEIDALEHTHREYYAFPEEWEEFGIADYVRGVYHL